MNAGRRTKGQMGDLSAVISIFVVLNSVCDLGFIERVQAQGKYGLGNSRWLDRTLSVASVAYRHWMRFRGGFGDATREAGNLFPNVKLAMKPYHAMFLHFAYPGKFLTSLTFR
jgi:hypothetical protein